MLGKKELFGQLLIRLDGLMKEKSSKEAKLEAICRLLQENVSYYDWVGFYVVDGENHDMLRLGPFVGEPTEHVRIPFGRGICGQAAAEQKTVVVQDVSKASNYLSCSLKVKSEIVVPVFDGDQFAGELDIDSHAASPFTEKDEAFLSKIAKIAGNLL